MVLTKEEREKIKGVFPYGFQTKLAKEMGIAPSLVNKYFKGEVNNFAIEERVVRSYSERIRKEKELRRLMEDAE